MLDKLLGNMQNESNSTTVVYGEEARRELYKGVEEVANAVGVTMGPKGRRVIIETDDPSRPLVTKDGVTVSKSINPSDPMKRMGAALVQEAASRTNEVAGDGTTTATVLTRELVFLANRQLTAGFDSVELANGMEDAVDMVTSKLAEFAIPASSKELLQQIATVSANGDTWLGSLVADAIHKVGLDGVVSVEDAKGTKTSVEIVEGTRFDRGYVSPYFVNEKEKMRCVHENAVVLITDRKISSLKDIIPVLEQCIRNNKPLLIVCDDIEGDALQGCVLNAAHGKVKLCVVKAPGPDKIEMLKDLSVLVGGKAIMSGNGDKLEEAKLEELGKCKKFSVDAKNCTIVADGTSAEAVSARAAELRKRLEDPDLDEEQTNIIRARLSRLTSGAAIIRVGGSTEIELNERKHRLEDSLHAARAALESGILPGGGSSLYMVSEIIQECMRNSERLTRGDGTSAGWRIVLEACKSPMRQIAKNAGKKMESLDLKNLTWGHGWNAATDTMVNLLESGIVDPLKVTSSAMQNALSVARTFLELDAVVYKGKETK